jgi:hypothetical protein
MTPENYDRSIADQQATQPDAIEDLSTESITSKDAEQVKGGFNPQPDPPKVAVDVSQIAARTVKY